VYQRPVCHCGHELFILEEHIHVVVKTISDQGKSSRTLKRVYTAPKTNRTLKCLKCRNSYRLVVTEDKEIVRGRKYAKRRVSRPTIDYEVRI